MEVPRERALPACEVPWGGNIDFHHNRWKGFVDCRLRLTVRAAASSIFSFSKRAAALSVLVVAFGTNCGHWARVQAEGATGEAWHHGKRPQEKRKPPLS